VSESTVGSAVAGSLCEKIFHMLNEPFFGVFAASNRNLSRVTRAAPRMPLRKKLTRKKPLYYRRFRAVECGDAQYSQCDFAVRSMSARRARDQPQHLVPTIAQKHSIVRIHFNFSLARVIRMQCSRSPRTLY